MIEADVWNVKSYCVRSDPQVSVHTFYTYLYNNVATPRDFLGTENTKFALD